MSWPLKKQQKRIVSQNLQLDVVLKQNTLHPTAGRPTLFSREEEKIFVQHINTLSGDFFLMWETYVKWQKTIWIKEVETRQDWITICLEEKGLIIFSNEIKLPYLNGMPQTSQSVQLWHMQLLTIFFENAQEELKSTDPCCILNYDETNLTDDPRSKKYIVKRGCKYPEKFWIRQKPLDVSFYAPLKNIGEKSSSIGNRHKDVDIPFCLKTVFPRFYYNYRKTWPRQQREQKYCCQI